MNVTVAKKTPFGVVAIDGLTVEAMASQLPFPIREGEENFIYELQRR